MKVVCYTMWWSFSLHLSGTLYLRVDEIMIMNDCHVISSLYCFFCWLSSTSITYMWNLVISKCQQHIVSVNSYWPTCRI
ncbi:hypothetical protein LINPERHAP1_LOCUS14767 [Linum perenne]